MPTVFFDAAIAEIRKHEDLALRLAEIEIFIPKIDEIIDLNRVLQERYQQRHGLRDRGLLESALGALDAAQQYGQTDPDWLSILLLSRIAKNHAFVDGNKRTAVFTMLGFRRANLLNTDLSSAVLERLVLDLVTGVSDEETAYQFLKAELSGQGYETRKPENGAKSWR